MDLVILQGTERGGRKRVTQKRWEDNIMEWTGMDFASSQRTTENREEWGRSVANAGGVPMTSS